MKHRNYNVWFGTVRKQVKAFSFLDAAILACAERINEGNDTEITHIGCVEFPELNQGSCNLELNID